MNSKTANSANSSISEQQYLRQVVEQQLDLILKMEEDRKLLKQENKVSSQQLKSLTLLVDKYNVSSQEIGISTDTLQEHAIPASNKQLLDQGIQASDSSVCNKKLLEAQSFLSHLDQSKPQEHNEQKQENICKPSKQAIKNRGSVTNLHKNVNAEVVKMSKEINSLKRQIKQAEHKTKLRDKQTQELRKCLKNKAEALQKSRKDFNQLSMLLNTDKYKSIRTLEQEVKALRSKLSAKGDQISHYKDRQTEKVSHLLKDLTAQYKEYKQESEMKLQILINELANKQKENDQLIQDQKKLLKKLQLAASDQ